MARHRHRHARHRREVGDLADARQVIERRLVHMAAEGVAAVGGHHAAHRLVAAQDVLPAGRRPGIGMHEQAAELLAAHRQPAQEVELLGRELGAGPLDGAARVLDQVRIGLAGHRVVMVAAHRDRALRDQVLHHRHHPGRIGAIADEVAQQRDAVGAMQMGLLETGLEGLAVGVNVGDQCNLHVDVSPVGHAGVPRHGIECRPHPRRPAAAAAPQQSGRHAARLESVRSRDRRDP